MPDETLILLAKEVRGKTLKLLDGVSDAAARFAAPGLQNSILWHAGHSVFVVEHLAVMPATGGKAPGYPPAWYDKFSAKSTPATVTDWPPLAQVIAELESQLPRLVEAVARLSPAQLATIVDPARNRTLRFSILHGLHDEANHQGEIWVLRKMLAARG